MYHNKILTKFIIIVISLMITGIYSSIANRTQAQILKTEKEMFMSISESHLPKYNKIAYTQSFYSSYIGGENMEGIWPRTCSIFDDEENIYIAGTTTSSDFPTVNAYDNTYNGGEDIFICKFSKNLSTLISSTFLGGKSNDRCYSIGLNANSHIVIAGTTTSTDFPMINAYDESFNGRVDIVVSILSNDLSTLLSSTYVGGNHDDFASSIVISKNNEVFIAGKTYSSNFPTVPGAFDETFNGQNDVIIMKFCSDLSICNASTFLGIGSIDDYPTIIQDDQGNVYVSGTTVSPDFPTTNDAYDNVLNGNQAIYISRLDNNLKTLISSTLIEGGFGYYLQKDYSGNIYVTTHAGSEFPVTHGSYDTTFNGGIADAAIAKLDPDLTQLLSSTFIGGTGNDNAMSICLDEQFVYISGHTDSYDFPINDLSFDTTFNGKDDAYISKLDLDLKSLIASSFIGGKEVEEGNSLILQNGFLLLTGSTSSYDFPTSSNAYDTSYNGDNNVGSYFGGDIYAFKIISSLKTEGNPPEKPAIEGPSSGKTGINYEYNCLSSDPDNDEIFYFIDWGDGTDSGRLGPFNSGEQCTVSHSWTSTGSYEIKVKAIDINGAESVWSDPLPVTIPCTHTSIILNFFDLFFQRIQNKFPIIQYLYG